jgi:phosphatidate cytidylyltransferase
VAVRSRSAIFVVAIGLIPAILGGPIFAAVFTAIMLAAFYEFVTMCGLEGGATTRLGYLAIVAFGAVPLLTDNDIAFRAVLALSIVAPVVRLLLLPVQYDHLIQWAIVGGATLMFGLPAYAAVDLRLQEGYSQAGWINDVADILPNRGDATGIGLGLFLFPLLVIWISDTFAYLVGRQIGRTKLIPHISPNKTVEGALGGLTAATVTGWLCVQLLGLDISTAAGFGLGAAVSLAGQAGDLVESMIKRMVNVKDSGNLIPGHGGVYDRVDALVFGILTVWVLFPVL